MTSRPVSTIFGLNGKPDGQMFLPTIFTAPIRPDIIHAVHNNINKNRRQPYGVSPKSGHTAAAGSWGTGRAVARIPRVHGGGTQRSGQGAFGNMCRGGHMFAPTKSWRRWQRKTNIKIRRYAVASAVSVSAMPALVLSRGHKIESVPEIPLVLNDKVESISSTSHALCILKGVGAYNDVNRVVLSRKIRRGKGKFRNRRYITKKGPMIVFKNDCGISRAFRNLPGVEVAKVDCLNLLKLAPGGHLGRFIIWTKSAVEALKHLWSTPAIPTSAKTSFSIPRPIMTNSDLTRLINSDEIQSVLRAPKEKKKKNAYKTQEHIKK